MKIKTRKPPSIKKSRISKKALTEDSPRTQKKAFKTSDENIFMKSSEILSRANADGSIAIIRVDSDKNFYSLDGIAANVWQLLDGKKSLQKIKINLSQSHKVDLDAISRDTNALVKKLLTHNLIKLKKA